MPSALALAVALLLAAGAFHVLIGVLTPIGMRMQWVPTFVIYNPEADPVVFGRSVEELRADRDLMKLRDILTGMVSGLLVGVGLLGMALAWWGVRAGQAWAVAALAVAHVGMAAFWAYGHRHWISAGMPGGFAALQPFQWVPLLLAVPGLGLAWWALR